MNKYLHPGIVFRVIIAIAYIILGIAIFILKFSSEFLQPKTKILFAMLVILYGVFRIYRALKMANAEDDI